MIRKQLSKHHQEMREAREKLIKVVRSPNKNYEYIEGYRLCQGKLCKRHRTRHKIEAMAMQEKGRGKSKGKLYYCFPCFEILTEFRRRNG